MRPPSLWTGFLVFLLTSILLISGEARLGPGSIQGADGAVMLQRWRLLQEEQQQQQQIINFEEAKKQDERVSYSPVEQQLKQEQEEQLPKKIEEEQQFEFRPQEKTEEQTKEAVKIEYGEKKEQEETLRVVEDLKKEVPKAWEEAKPEEKTNVDFKEVNESRFETSDDGSKREEQLLAESLVLEKEENQIQEEVKPYGEQKPEITPQDKEIVSLSSEPKTTYETTEQPQQQQQQQQQQQLLQPDVRKEETYENETKEEKKDVLVTEYSYTEGRNESQQQQEKKEPEQLGRKEEEKPAETKVVENIQSSPTERTTEKVDLQVEEKKSDPVAQQIVNVTSEQKEEEIKVEEQQQEKQKDETEKNGTKQEDKQEQSISTDSTDSADPEDDYPDFFDEFWKLPERLQQSADNLKTNVPGWEKLSTNSKDLFNQANEQIKVSFTPLIGSEYAPVVAYVVSYGLLLLPLGLVFFLFERIRAIFSLQKVLLFINIYVAAYFAALVVAAFILGGEPMDFFRKFSPSSYIFLQLLQAFGYIMFIILQTFDLITTCSSGRIAAKLSAALQWLVVVAVGFHYYVTVFHRAMAKAKPLTSWKVFALYSIAFSILCAFARIERGKKQYIQEGGEGSTKQN